MYKLWLLYWAPEGCEWRHGWEHRYFDAECDAIAYCRDNLELIEIAEIMPSGACIVSDGKLTSEVCEGYNE